MICAPLTWLGILLGCFEHRRLVCSEGYLGRFCIRCLVMIISVVDAFRFIPFFKDRYYDVPLPSGWYLFFLPFEFIWFYFYFISRKYGVRVRIIRWVKFPILFVDLDGRRVWQLWSVVWSFSFCLLSCSLPSSLQNSLFTQISGYDSG